MQKIWFTADTHFFHKNILKHCPERMQVCGAQDENDIESWNDFMIERWNSTVAKKDLVYIVGDFAFGNPENVRKLLGKLYGKKYLILGNHDKSSDKEELANYFVQVTQQKLVIFKKSNHVFLDEDFHVFMCHYPMVTWPSKHYGVTQVHGHCHGRLDSYNDVSTDLRVDVGVDGKLGNFNLVSLEQLYRHFKEKAGGDDFIHYASEAKKQGMTI